MDLLKRLFGGPPQPFDLMQRHDVAGLIAALGHSLPWVRRDAALALGQLQDPQARTALTAVLHDPDGEVHHAAQAALAQFNEHDLQRQ